MPGPPAERAELAAEQGELLELLRSLTPDEWLQPSRCDGWTVRDVVAHLVEWDGMIAYRSRRQYAPKLVVLAGRYVRAGLSMDRLNRRLLARDERPPAELIQDLEGLRRRPRRLFDRLAPDAQLAEFVAHQEDIRRPLGRTRHIAPERRARAVRGLRRVPGVAPS